MKRRIPIEHFVVIENCLSSCNASVEWKEVWLACLEVNFCVRQGSVLSPYLFNVYLDYVATLNNCYKRTFVIIYADNNTFDCSICLGSRISSIRAHKKSYFFDKPMIISTKKCCCMRIGLRRNVSCANIATCCNNSFPC